MMASATEESSVPDELSPTQSPENMEVALAESRASAVRLLENLAQKIGASRAVKTAADSFEKAAQYVQAKSVKDLAAGIDRAVRRRPASSIAVAVVAGFLVGRALRSR
jgi:ElaB/YqjD/DUF883 family membrane-anchored ribosome-binding protein